MTSRAAWCSGRETSRRSRRSAPRRTAGSRQVRERDRRLQRVADGVLEPAAALQPARDLGGHAAGLGMDEDEHAERLRLGPERMKLRVRELLAVDAAADGRPA